MIIQIIISGIIMGLIYGLVATGLTLTWGVLDIINFTHGEYLMISMYVSFWLYSLMNLDPLLSLPIVIIVMFIIGYLTYSIVVKNVINAPALSALLATFGLSLVFRNMAQFLWTPNARFITNSVLSGKKISIGSIIIGYPQLAAAIGSIVVIYAIYYFIEKTKVGKSIQATALDKNTAKLMGINTERVYGLTFAISGAAAGIAGGLLSTFYPVYPESGILYALIGFVIVALGGFGNIKGALYGGLIIGLSEAVGGYYLGTQFKYAIIFLIYLIVIQIKPKGLFGW
jgi:branched-chain amino acid transport system permease protein